MITRESLMDDLHRIGVSKGDVLCVSADLSRIFFDERSSTIFPQLSAREIVDLLLFVVGDKGTLVAPHSHRVILVYLETPIFFLMVRLCLPRVCYQMKC